MVRKVIWSRAATQQLANAYEYIILGSYQSAQKVKNAIFATTGKLSFHPTIHPLDKYRLNNDGSFRAFELYRYRIAYRVTEKEIIILRVRHTSMEPLPY